MDNESLSKSLLGSFKSCDLIHTREDEYQSRYFDYQRAYRYRAVLQDDSKIECTAYLHFLKGQPTTLAIDVSTMVGCPVGCRFCAAGAIKFERPLTNSEMSDQAEYLISIFDDAAFPKITCSFQGIGEPSLVARDVLFAARRLVRGNSKVHISIATTLTNSSAIDLWGGSDVVFDNLQLSCSATNRTTRNRIVPDVRSAHDIFYLARLCLAYPNFRKVKINYILMVGVNDSNSDLDELASLAAQSGLTVKISTLNPTKTSRRFGLVSSDIIRARRFRDELTRSGIDSYIYGAFDGTTVSCGQLLEPGAILDGAP